MTDAGRAAADVYQVLRCRQDSLTEPELRDWVSNLRQAVARSEMTIAIARDGHGRPLAMAATTVDDMVCLINQGFAATHEARWALHDHIVQMLIARRVRYLLADGGGPFGALGFTSNVRHFQHLLGYELCHVIPVVSVE
ncbi:MAG TPA: hypothetical protein VME22_24390 [Solirubrobacteraceae bacterium]|nr:hypothetical protein [Solirubrobacteraceae bacterium]